MLLVRTRLGDFRSDESEDETIGTARLACKWPRWEYYNAADLARPSIWRTLKTLVKLKHSSLTLEFSNHHASNGTMIDNILDSCGS